MFFPLYFIKEYFLLVKCILISTGIRGCDVMVMIVMIMTVVLNSETYTPLLSVKGIQNLAFNIR